MPSGGYRPGAGRKTGAKDKQPRRSPRKAAPAKATGEEKERISKMLSFDLKAKTAMYQDFLVKISQGKKLTLDEKKVMIKLGAELSGEGKAGKKPQPSRERRDPLTYMLDIMNDEEADPDLRFRAAATAAPFIHAKAGEGMGKKDARADRAGKAGAGKFAPGAPPQLKVVGK